MSDGSSVRVPAKPLERTIETRPAVDQAEQDRAPAWAGLRGWSPPAPPAPPASNGKGGANHAFGQVSVYSELAQSLMTRGVVGTPHNRYEREADRAADLVVEKGKPVPAVALPAEPDAPLRRKPLDENEDPGDEDGEREAKHPETSAVPARKSAVPPGLQRLLAAAGAEGRALPAAQRDFYEKRFGHSFRAVRVHAGPRAADAAAALGAKAFTHGRDVYFGKGHYRPATGPGQWLLAHELAHTVQQNPAAPTIQRQPEATPVDSVAVMEPPAPLAGEVEPAPKGGAPKAPAEQAGQAGRAGAGGAAGSPGSPAAAAGKPEGKEVPESKEAPESKQAIEDQAKSAVKASQKEEVAAGPEAEGKAKTPAAGKEGEAPAEAEVSKLAGISTGDLALIDKELAEHQRWGQASSKVGAAGSAERAKFITEAAAAGGGFTEGLIQGAKFGAGIKIAEKVIEKGAVKLATRAATRLGTQVVKFTPLPAVGAVIGGVMAAYDLSQRDWSATGETIGRFGKGASVYDKLANSIESVSTVLDVATQVLNVIAGIIGAISIAMWVITVLTVGIASPLAATLSSIAVGIGLATLELDGINALVLKQLITVFRSLHAFTSEADPRDVLIQGEAIGKAAGAAGGFVGGFAGGVGVGLVEKGAKALTTKKPSTPVPDHSLPPPASGEGPTVKAEPPEAGAVPKETGTPPVEAETTAKAGAVTPAEPQTGGTKAAEVGEPTPKPRKKLTRKQLAELAKKEDLTPADIDALADHLGESPQDVRDRFARAAFESTVQEQTARSQGGAVDPELRNIPERPSYLTPEEMRRIKQVKGEGTMPKRVEKSIRAASRERFTAQNIEAAKDVSKHTPLTVESRENVAGHGLEYMEPFEGGKAPEYHETRGFGFVEPEDVQPGGLPRGYEESHIVPVKQEPAFAGKEASVAESKSQHFGETHAANPAAELEALTRRGQPSPGFQTEFSPQAGVIAENKKILRNLETRIEDVDRRVQNAERRAQKAEAQGKTEQAQKARDDAQRYRDESKSLGLQAQKLRDAIPQLEKIVASASKEQRRDLGRPSRKSAAPQPASSATSSAAEATAVAAGVPPATQATVPAPEVTTPAAPTLQATPVAPAAPAPQPAPALELAPATQPATVPSATPAPQSRPAPSGGPALPPSYLAPAAYAGSRAGGGGAGPKEDLNADLPELGRLERGPISGTEKALYYGGATALLGVAGTGVAALAASGYERARREPVIEHVNPNYPPPPATPQQIVDVQNEILEILDSRAQAEAASAAMARQAADHKANEKPLAKMGERTAKAISATEAHQQAVARRTDANKSKAGNEEQVAGKLSDYSTRAAKLTTITVPMRAFERFTSLAHSLPDSPSVLVGAKRGILKMNADSKRFLKQLDSVDQTINAQKASQPERNKQIQEDAGALKQTDSKAKESDQTLNKAKDTTKDLQNDNKKRLDQANKLRAGADQNVKTLNNQEQAKRAEADGLASSLQTWAQNHRKARLDALEQTKTRLEQQGYKVVEAKES